MRPVGSLLVLILIVTLTACGEPPPPPDIIKAQREALDKAKGVEQTLQQQAEDTQKKIHEAESK